MSLNHVLGLWGPYLAFLFTLWLSFIFLSQFAVPYIQAWLKSTPAKFSNAIPAIVIDGEWFKAGRASLRQLTDGMTTLLSGYSQYSKHGKAFIVHEPSLQQELMIPPEHIRWFSGQPDSKMSSRTIREERHAVGYLHVGVEFNSTLFFLERIIRDSLTRNLDAIQKPMYEEIQRGFDDIYGTDEEWKTINVYESLQKLILPVMTRVFFGLSLGRDESFLKTFERYNLAMGVGTLVVGQLPRIFKSLLVPFFNMPLRFFRRMTLNKLVPEVQRQLEELDSGSEESFISQCAKVSARSANLEAAKNPNILAEWLMLAGFAAMSSTVIQVSNSVLDIINCDPQLDLYGQLRQEAQSVIKTDSNWHESATFNSLVLYDSVIRESLRCHPILIKGLTKEVIDPEGLSLPDGTHLPKGSWVGVPVVGVHRDERFYPDPRTYNPYRFLHLKQKADPRVSASELDAARPSVTYLGFGYGRHACPGRWFAVVMIKTMLAYLTLNYDVEAMGPQPKTNVIGDAALPPISATIRIRRRKVASA